MLCGIIYDGLGIFKFEFCWFYKLEGTKPRTSPPMLEFPRCFLKSVDTIEGKTLIGFCFVLTPLKTHIFLDLALKNSEGLRFSAHSL